MSPKKKSDKRLYAARVIGIILFAASILLFFICTFSGFQTMFFPSADRMGDSDNMILSLWFDWYYDYKLAIIFFVALLCVPLYFASQALYRFKEWGRRLCIIMLFIMIGIFWTVGIEFFAWRNTAAIFTAMMFIRNIGFTAAMVAGIYFLMRRSTREGIRDHNSGDIASAEMTDTAAASVETVPAPLPPIEADPRYELAKRMVADVRDVPLPAKKRKAALIVAGIMMIAFPAIWAFFTFILMLNFNGIEVLSFALSLLASVCSVWMGVKVISHQIKYRLMAILVTLANLIMIIVLLHDVGFQGVLFFCAYYVAILALLLINYNKFYDEEMDDDVPLTEKILSPMEMEKQELQALAESKTNETINKEEFEQKTIEIKVKYRSSDMAESLLKRKNNGMLSEEEYQTKLNRLMAEKQEEVMNEMRLEKEKQQIHNLRLSQIAPERIEKLTIPNRSRLNKYIALMEPGDIIVFHDHQIKLLRAERWVAINEANTQGEFEVILYLQPSL